MKLRLADIRVEKIPHNGHLILRATVNDTDYKMTYIGYSIMDAKRQFVADIISNRAIKY
jgi:hypothetical protein